MAKLLERSLHQHSTPQSLTSTLSTSPRLTDRIDRARQLSHSGASTSGREYCKVKFGPVWCSKEISTNEGYAYLAGTILEAKDFQGSVLMVKHMFRRLAQLILALRHLTTQS